jgi:hypothetical protein
MNYQNRIEELLLLADRARLSESQTEILVMANVLGSQRLAEKLNTLAMYQATPRFLLLEESPFPLVPSEISYGQVYIGHVLDDDIAFFLNLDELGQHCLITGRSRVGKTNLIYLIIASLRSHGVNILAIDLKQDYRHLKRVIPNLWVMRVGASDFRYNPLEVHPGTDPRKAAQTKAHTISHAFGLLTGSQGYVYQAIDDLYRLFGVYEGKDTFPTMFDLQEYLLAKEPKNKYSPSAQYHDRVTHRIDTVCRAMPDTLNCSKGYPLDEILSHNVVLEIENLIPEIQNYFVESFWTDIFMYQISNGRRGRMRHCFVFDEANRIFSYKTEQNLAEKVSVISDLVAKIGEFQIGLLVASQVPSLLNKAIRANTYTKIMLKLSDSEDVSMMARSMGLTQEQVAFCHDRLETGTAVVRLSGRHMQPFAIQIPLYEIQKDVSDEEVRRHMEPILRTIPFTPRTDILQKLKEERTKKTEQKVSRPIQLLKDIYTRPWLTVTEHYESIGVGTKIGTKLKKDLLRWRWIEEVRIKTGRRGKQPIVLSVTDVGMKKLREAGIEVKRIGKGGAKSVWWSHRIAEHYKGRGCNVKIEGYAEGKSTVDVEVVDKAGRRTAIEIQISTVHALENIIKDVKAGYDEVVIACEDERTLNGIRKKAETELTNDVLKQVRYRLLQEVLDG